MPKPWICRAAPAFSMSRPEMATPHWLSPAVAAAFFQPTMSTRCSPPAANGPRPKELDVDYQIADVEDLPFENASFDAVVSTFGVMFAPNQEAAASEMKRVCRSGGKIGMANWTPDSFIGALFRTLGKHVSPPTGVQSPARWGTAEWIKSTFGPSAAKVEIEMRNYVFRYPSPKQFVDFFRTWYGPVHKAFASLDEAGQKALEADILKTIEAYDTAKNGEMRVPSEYAQIVITKA